MLFDNHDISTAAVKLETVEAFCCECMKYFSNVDYLKEHVQLTHQSINCDVCGTKQLRKNMKRHLRTHEKKNSADSEAFRCDVEGCGRVFSTVRCSRLYSRYWLCMEYNCLEL